MPLGWTHTQGQRQGASRIGDNQPVDRVERFPRVPLLSTPRLELREITAADADWYLAHFSRPEIVHGQGYPAPADRAAAEEELRHYVLDMFSERRGFRWGIALNGSQELIGSFGLYNWVDGPPPQAELGYDLAVEWWGHGLMTEALTAVLDFAFGPMLLERVEALVITDNDRSIRLLERAGFYLEQRVAAHGRNEHGELVDEYRFVLDRG
jgi:ribosomal-protein-alanine N-acetyltransferase